VLNAPQVFLANVEGPWLHPEKTTVEQLVHVARSCPSGAISYRRLDGGEEEPAPQVNAVFLRQDGPYAFLATLDIRGVGGMFCATLCRCGQSKNKPFCDNSHRDAGFRASGEPATLADEALAERGGPLQVEPLRDGPLKVTGPLEICCGTGRTVARTLSTRLCRCGASANKPFCDGSHRHIGFRSEES
jgi:CDGSH-type Zn-finger protein